MVALHDHYGCPNTTFLAGPTFTTAFADPNPVTTGRITPILDDYQAHWYLDDEGVAAMVDYAQSNGWVDEDGEALQAHVVRRQ